MFVVLIVYDVLILVFLDRLTDTWTDRQAKQLLNLTLCMHTWGKYGNQMAILRKKCTLYYLPMKSKTKCKIILCRGVTYFIVLVADHATFTSYMLKYFTCNNKRCIGKIY